MLLVALLLSADAAAQTLAPPVPPGAPIVPPAPAFVGPRLPSAPSAGSLRLSATFAGDQQPIRSGLVWRVFADKADGSGEGLVARSGDATPTFSLAPGTYSVHVAYGFASAMKQITVGDNAVDSLAISAGALRIAGAIGDAPIPNTKLTFSVFVPVAQNPEGRLIVANARPGDLIRLPEGTYQVVSTYGDSNAITRAELRVEPGKIVEATLNHRAATVTLKLVRTAGGEAFAGTAFSVLTPGGDVIREAIGAFPSFILAEGDYVVIARHEGQVYTREFKVVSGLDRDIEVTAK